MPVFSHCGLSEMPVLANRLIRLITLNLIRDHNIGGTMQKDLLGDQDQGLQQDETVKGATTVAITDNNPFIQISKLATYRQRLLTAFI